ncbi:MAG: DNA polymerase III subunit beta [Candidatus Taylorbacteria bacterium]|nr:DNA polymerase III subunit beta [Candidatus Taylorbacteria bacterium]
MKYEIQFEKFKQAIFLAERIAGHHLTLPILSCILIDIKNGTAFIRATNLDVGIEIELAVKGDGDVIFAVPAHILSSFLSQINSKEQIIRLEISSGNLHISLSKSKGVIKTLPSEDFPAIPMVSDGKSSSFPGNVLIKGFKSVWYSAAISNVKPELASVFIYRDAENAVFVATDSFRLAEKKVALPKGASIEDMLIPFKNSIEIVKMLEAAGPTVMMHSNKNLVSFEANGIHITSRIIDGVFPDYRQIIPKNFSTEAVVLKQDLINTLKVSTVFSDAFNQIHVVVDPKKKIFQIDTKNSDVGENQSLLDAAITGEPVEINFNCKYISDSFQAIDADSVSLQFNGKNKPLVIRPISGDQTFLYLVMPMNR